MPAAPAAPPVPAGHGPSPDRLRVVRVAGTSSSMVGPATGSLASLLASPSRQGGLSRECARSWPPIHKILSAAGVRCRCSGRGRWRLTVERCQPRPNRHTIGITPKTRHLTVPGICIRGSDGGSVTPLRYVPPGAIIIAEPPERNPVGTSRRSSYQQPRAGRLTSVQIEAIRRINDRTLRQLAAEYGVSHETIRAARRTRTPDVA